MSDPNPLLNTNPNLLQPTKFRLVFNRIPNVEYMLTSVILPGINLPQAIQPTPFRDRPMPGNKLDWGELDITFNVTESLVNWKEIFSWMKAIGKPESPDNYKSVFNPAAGRNNVYSDASLIILSSHNNGNIRISFKDCWPARLSGIDFSTMFSANEPISVTATFYYLEYDLELVNP